MTSRKFWVEFAKIARRFRIGKDGSIRTKDLSTCPVCEVANVINDRREDPWRLSHRLAADAIGLDRTFADTVAGAADFPLRLLWGSAAKRVRKKMFKIMGRTRGL